MKKEMLPRSNLSRSEMNNLWKYLSNNEESVLFLLDGWDELPTQHQPEILDLIQVINNIIYSDEEVAPR